MTGTRVQSPNCRIDLSGEVWYNGGMKSAADKRRMLVVAMQPAMTILAGLWAGVWPAISVAYRSVWAVAGDNLLAGGGRWRRVRSERGLRELGRVRVPEESLAELQHQGAALAAELQSAATDVLVCGDAAALRSAARLALWTRTAAPATRWIGVPCCPYNSVPFTVCSVGYASALRYCAEIVRRAMRRTGGVAPAVHIEGDAHGWLGLGLAALLAVECADTSEPLRLGLGPEMTCAKFDARLGRALGRAIVQRARYAAPGIMLTVRLRAGGRAPVIEHLALTESMYAPRGIPEQYKLKTSGKPTPAMRALAEQLCAPWRHINTTGRHTRDAEKR